MLDKSLLEQLKEIFSSLEGEYFLSVTSDKSSHAEEMVELVEEMAQTSAHIHAEIKEGEELKLELLKGSEKTGITFKAVPGGHEFNSLLLALLNADGKGKNLPDEYTQQVIKGLKGPIHLKTYMSLSCTNCPDVVQALNVFALLNPGITHEAIDGSLHAQEVEQLKIQAVPTVIADGKIIHIGRGSMDVLLSKLQEEYGCEETKAAETRRFDLLVAGAGPAGCAAAVYAARKGQKVAIIANRMGGQVNETQAIENLISVPQTLGKQLAADLRAHVDAYDIEIWGDQSIVDFSIVDGMKHIETSTKETFEAPELIIATGASWRKLGVPGESEYTGRGVAFCPHCDGPFYKGKDVAVIGGGNSGIEAAIDLAGICKSVTVLEFLDELKADAVLQEKAASLPNVSVKLHRQTLEAIGDGEKLVALKIKDRHTEQEETLTLDGVFVQIGLSANSAPFKELLTTNRAGEIEVGRNCRTQLPGVYAAGDVTDVAYKQIIISMGEGAKAALSAFNDQIKGCWK